MKHLALLFCTLSLVLVARPARAQLPSCDGSDADGATAAFEEGNRLMAEAIEQAGRRRLDRARELAAEALASFDLQCELGDTGALAERGAALMLMGEPLRSAQSYDAYLRAHPLGSLDARTRRRIEANLQPGSLEVILAGDGAATLFVDDLDFGPLPREVAVRLPTGEHHIEARSASGDVLADATAMVSEGSGTSITLVLPSEPVVVREPDPEPEPEPEPEPVTPPSDRTDFLPFEIATGAATAVFLGLGIGLQVAASDRAQLYNDLCRNPLFPYAGCDAVLSEYDGLFGAAITSYVLAGLAAAGLVTVIVLDVSQPREAVRIGVGPGAFRLSGSF